MRISSRYIDVIYVRKFANKYTVLLIPLAILLIFCSLSFIKKSVKPNNSAENVRRYPQEDLPLDIFLISAYYYPNSTSLGNNAVALTFTGSFRVLGLIRSMEFIAWNGTHNVIDKRIIRRITPHNVCYWISMQIRATTLPNMSNFAVIMGNQYKTIPFKLPVYKKHDVVTCISPLFANEQWQYALFAAHTYKKYGAYMHLYIRSMITPMLKMLQIYEREGYMTIQPWMRINLAYANETEFNPNVNIEFRNQAAAQTDCLLLYKESATFISFMDLDDILIPRMGKTYFEEFDFIFSTKPNAAFIHYGKENVEVKGQLNPVDFSLVQMYSSIKYKQVNETGKFITRPELINSTWIHWPTKIPEGYERYDVPIGWNSIVHLKLMEEETNPPDNTTITIPIYNPTTGSRTASNLLLSAEDIEWIQRDFEKMLQLPEVAKLYKQMPRKLFYFYIILKCFNDTFYKFHYSGQMNKITCPGPERCEFPRKPGIKCSNSDGKYFSTANNTILNIHYVQDEIFKIEDGCRP